eukprot:jgi/Ulvmu1/8189/UM040_0086.1
MASHYDALRQAVVNSLESRGVLAKLRAELTYEVFESVDATEHSDTNSQRDALLGSGKDASLAQSECTAAIVVH